MLKLNYTDCGLFLEKVPAPLNKVATQRMMLAVQVGEPLHLEPGRAAFLLPLEINGITHLKSIAKTHTRDTINVTTVDDEFIEVSLKGTWIANSPNAESGTFITALAPECECLLYQLWRVTQ